MTAADRSRVEDVVATFLRRVNKAEAELSDELGLFGGGLELDSLEVAELSALLEDEFGSDPFSRPDVTPARLGDVYAFYVAA